MPQRAGRLVLNMSNTTLERLAWILIYGGMILLMLGLWLLERDAVIGAVVSAAGGVLASAGVLMIWLRSRRPADGRDAGQLDQ